MKEKQKKNQMASDMGGEWVKRKIGSLGRVVTGKTPPTVDSSNFGGAYPFITIPDLDGRVLIDRTERTLSDRGAEILRSCLLPPGSVMMSCIATVGKCGTTTRPSFTNQQINSVIPNDEVDSRFLYYVFTQLGHELESAGGGGSVYTNVSKNRFSDIEVVAPADIGEQRAIAHILGTLDDKIELNRRMSRTLEEMARAIFKSWFVDFDPVRAKCRGEPMCSPPIGQAHRPAPTDWHWPRHILDLFPDRLVDSELGEIPEGWRVGAVGDLAEVSSGKRPNVRFPDASEQAAVPLWGGNGPIAFVPEVLVDEPILLTGRVGTLGSVFRITTPCWPSDNTLVLRANQQAAFEYLYLQLQQIDFTSLNRGSTQPLLTQTDLKALPLLLPQLAVLERFSVLARTLYNRNDEAVAESRTLASIRDELLPKLISGEIRVRDAERILRERGL
uniref:Restriction endonuclease subunit S n=1 Tax=Desulfatirhabdium butyrativorans TaxID=340467 RepID=A0A7C4W6R9_9BACT